MSTELLETCSGFK